jgi:putative nucleotidyltransferase with HDIG domain
MDFIKAYTIDSLEIHANNVRRYSSIIGGLLGLKKSDMELLELAAYLHDIGKNNIPLSILLKPSKLTDDEYMIIKEHPVVGSKMANDLKLDKRIVNAIKYHHERFDGKGYKEGLKGNEIPLFSRIISIADAYDVITSSRAYKVAFSHEYAMIEMKKYSGSQFDGELLELFEGQFLIERA